jgi:hypothetical protein
MLHCLYELYTPSQGKEVGALRTPAYYLKTQQYTDRIARTARNVAICRTFLRAALLLVIACPEKYRPQIDRLEMSRFAGLSPPR